MQTTFSSGEEASLKATCNNIINLVLDEEALRLSDQHEKQFPMQWNTGGGISNNSSSRPISAFDLRSAALTGLSSPKRESSPLMASSAVTPTAAKAVRDQLQTVAVQLHRLNIGHNVLPIAKQAEALTKAERAAKDQQKKINKTTAATSSSTTDESIQRLIISPDTEQVKRLISAFAALAICQPALWESLTSQPSGLMAVETDETVDQDDDLFGDPSTNTSGAPKRVRVAKQRLNNNRKITNIRLRKIFGDVVASFIPDTVNFYVDKIMNLAGAVATGGCDSPSLTHSPLLGPTSPATFPLQSPLEVVPTTAATSRSVNAAAVDRSLQQEALQKGFAARRSGAGPSTFSAKNTLETASLASTSRSHLGGNSLGTFSETNVFKDLLVTANTWLLFTPHHPGNAECEKRCVTPTTRTSHGNTSSASAGLTTSSSRPTSGLTSDATSVGSVTPSSGGGMHKAPTISPAAVSPTGHVTVERPLFPTSTSPTTAMPDVTPTRSYPRPPPLADFPSPSLREEIISTAPAVSPPISGSSSTVRITLTTMLAETLVRCLCGEALAAPPSTSASDSLGVPDSSGSSDQMFFIPPSSTNQLLQQLSSSTALNRSRLFSATVGGVARSAEATKEYYGDLFRNFSHQTTALSGTKRQVRGEAEEEEDDGDRFIDEDGEDNGTSLIGNHHHNVDNPMSFINPLFVPWDRIVSAMSSAVKDKTQALSATLPAVSKKARVESNNIALADPTTCNPFLAHYCAGFAKLHSKPAKYFDGHKQNEERSDFPFDAATYIPAPPSAVSGAPFECLLCGEGVIANNKNGHHNNKTDLSVLPKKKGREVRQQGNDLLNLEESDEPAALLADSELFEGVSEAGQRNGVSPTNAHYTNNLKIKGLLHCRSCNRYIHLRCVYPTQRDMRSDAKGGFQCHGCRLRMHSAPMLTVSGPSTSLLDVLVRDELTKSQHKVSSNLADTLKPSQAALAPSGNGLQISEATSTISATVVEITDSSTSDDSNGATKRN